MDILDMEGQTAPESTRGLFDPPQEPKVKKIDGGCVCVCVHT